MDMRYLLQDLRYGFRQLIRMPGFTLTAVISLALGIGATTAVFSVVYAILMDPYPYAGADRMIHLRLQPPSGELRGFGLTGAQWQELRKSPVIEDAFAAERLEPHGHRQRSPRRRAKLSSSVRTHSIIFGVPPALGRGLQPSDAIDGQDPQPVVVLSYKFWKRHFYGNPAVVGQDHADGPQELHDCRSGRAALHMVRRRCLSAPKDHAGSDPWVLRRRTPQARHHPCAGRCCPAAAYRTICPRDPEALSPADSSVYTLSA